MGVTIPFTMELVTEASPGAHLHRIAWTILDGNSSFTQRESSQGQNDRNDFIWGQIWGGATFWWRGI